MRNNGRWMEILSRILMGLGVGTIAFCYSVWYGAGAMDILIAWAGVYMMAELHQALFAVGRLIGGRMTGYRLIEIQLGPVLWKRSGTGGLQRTRVPFRRANSGCLMSPPDLNDGKMPYKLYLQGGSLVDLVASAIAAWGAVAAWRAYYPMAAMLLAIFAVMGPFRVLNSVLPLRRNGIGNAGYNARMMGRYPESVRALWSALRIYEQMVMGKAVSDMPEEWFFAPSGEGMARCSLCATVGMDTALRRICEKRFQEALDLIEPFEKVGLGALENASIRINIAFCKLMLGQGKEAAQAHLDKVSPKDMEKLGKKGSSYRIAYAMALLGEGDEQKAEEIRAKFEAYAAQAPGSAGAETRRLMDFVREKYDETRIGREAE